MRCWEFSVLACSGGTYPPAGRPHQVLEGADPDRQCGRFGAGGVRMLRDDQRQLPDSDGRHETAEVPKCPSVSATKGARAASPGAETGQSAYPHQRRSFHARMRGRNANAEASHTDRFNGTAHARVPGPRTGEAIRGSGQFQCFAVAPAVSSRVRYCSARVPALLSSQSAMASSSRRICSQTLAVSSSPARRAVATRMR